MGALDLGLFRVGWPSQLALSMQGREAGLSNLWERVLDTALIARLRRLMVAHYAACDTHFSEIVYYKRNRNRSY
jgi:hypothetical protein